MPQAVAQGQLSRKPFDPDAAKQMVVSMVRQREIRIQASQERRRWEEVMARMTALRQSIGDDTTVETNEQNREAR